MSYVIVKTTSHRAYRQVKSIPGAFGPYWRPGRKSDSIFDRVDGEFWLVPEVYAPSAGAMRSVTEAPRAKVEELGRFLFGSGSEIPSAIDVVKGA